MNRHALERKRKPSSAASALLLPAAPWRLGGAAAGESEAVRVQALMVLRNLSCAAENEEPIWQHVEARAALIDGAGANQPVAVQVQALWALRNLTFNPGLRPSLVQAGVRDLFDEARAPERFSPYDRTAFDEAFQRLVGVLPPPTEAEVAAEAAAEQARQIEAQRVELAAQQAEYMEHLTQLEEQRTALAVQQEDFEKKTRLAHEQEERVAEAERQRAEAITQQAAKPCWATWPKVIRKQGLHVVCVFHCLHKFIELHCSFASIHCFQFFQFYFV